MSPVEYSITNNSKMVFYMKWFKKEGKRSLSEDSIFQNKWMRFFRYLIIILIIFIVVLTELRIFFDTNGMKYNFEMVISLITLLGTLVALVIPFLMKDLEKKKQTEQEIALMKLAIKRIEQFFILQGASNKPSGIAYFSSEKMPFFVGLSRTKPEVLYKIGIEVEVSENITYLYILDKYRLFLGGFELYLNWRDVHGHIDDMKYSMDLFEEIKSEMIHYAKDNFKIDISDSKK
jgi:hypothetical protein